MQKAVTVGKIYRLKKKPNILLYATPALMILNNLHLKVANEALYTAILIACFCIAMFLNFQVSKLSMEFWISIVAIAVAFVNTLVNGSGLGSFITFANLLLYVVYFSQVCLTEKEKSKVLKLTIASLLVTVFLFCNRNSINGYYYSLIGKFTKERINANMMALLFFFTYVFVVMQITTSRKLKNKNTWQVLSFLLFALLIFISDSRTAFVVFLGFALANYINIKTTRNEVERTVGGQRRKGNKFRKTGVFTICFVSTFAFTFLYCSLYNVIGSGFTILGHGAGPQRVCGVPGRGDLAGRLFNH